MPRSLAPIPAGVAIVDKEGTILDFFRLRWQELVDGFQASPLANSIGLTGLFAALPATSVYLTKAAGLCRISYYIHKTVADGVNSSLTVTLGWTEGGVPMTHAFAALTLDTTGANQFGEWTVPADAATDLTIQIAYASNTPAKMRYLVDAWVETLT